MPDFSESVGGFTGGRLRPLVSCICITHNRRLFLRQAIDQFVIARDAYRSCGGDAEMVIIDGGDWPRPEKPFVEGVRHVDIPPVDSVLQVGKARNQACDMAKGEIIIQWDDDDWQNPWRIANQVASLENADLTFSSWFYSYHIQVRKACKSRCFGLAEGSAPGAFFAYRKSAWKRHPFLDAPMVGEEITFYSELLAEGAPIVDSQDDSLVVYIRHNMNGSALTEYRWNDEDTVRARGIMKADLDFYDGIGELLPVANWNHPNAPGSKVHVMNPMQQLWARHYR